MPSSIETMISQLLTQHKNTKIVGEALCKAIKENDYEEPDKKAVIQFLIQSENFKMAFNLFEKWFNQQNEVPWGCFLTLLKTSKTKLKKESFNFIFEGAIEQEGLPSLVESWNFDSMDQRFENLRVQIQNERQQNLIKLKEDLLDKISYLKNSRMIDEEKKSLEKLFILFPKDENNTLLQKDFKLRWARNVISQSQLDAKTQSLLSSKNRTIEPKEEEFRLSLVSFMKKHLKKHPQMVMDFAIGLYFMEFYDSALEVLEFENSTLPAKWLKIEILILSEKHIEALECLKQIESELQKDPEIHFSTIYLKAQCLWGLGQKNHALELMSGLVSVRPQYRAANSLLNLWSEVPA